MSKIRRLVTLLSDMISHAKAGRSKKRLNKYLSNTKLSEGWRKDHVYAKGKGYES